MLSLLRSIFASPPTVYGATANRRLAALRRLSAVEAEARR